MTQSNADRIAAALDRAISEIQNGDAAGSYQHASNAFEIQNWGEHAYNFLCRDTAWADSESEPDDEIAGRARIIAKQYAEKSPCPERQ